MLDDQLIICRRCGFQEFVPGDKRKRADGLCRDCRVKPAKSIGYGLVRSCLPWSGEFDVDDNPLLNGKLFLVGERVCGHRDCVEVSHIIVG